MDPIHPCVLVTIVFSFLVLVQRGTEAQLCSANHVVEFPENNTEDAVVVNITAQENVVLDFKTQPGPNYPFRLNGNQLLATKVLDHESSISSYNIEIICRNQISGTQITIAILVLVTDVNDNPPTFAKNPYHLNVSEMTPVGMVVGNVTATDLDSSGRLYYTLTSDPAGFQLLSPFSDKIIADKLLHYETVKTVELKMTAQDTPLPPADVQPSFTATTTVLVNIIDIDNRPPWFQPCTKHIVGGAVICQDNGYTGDVQLNEQQTGALLLKPGPLYAVDGDQSINAPITYSFLSGNPGDLFDINSSSGNITVKKVVDVLGPINLTVLAVQLDNSYQFAITTVIIKVLVKSQHPPRFEKQQYDGVVAAAGTMVMDMKNKDEPLKVLAIDEDYASAGGLNPNIIYSVKGSSDFTIINGYIFMTASLPAGTLSLQVEAVDEPNKESATAQLSVEVTAGLSSTTVLPSTTDITSPTPTEETSSSVSTTDPSVSTNGSVSTANPSATSDIITSSTNPSGHTGEFGTEDMMAVGITLGILLLISLVIIGLLAYQIRIGKAEWKKIYEASVFRSTLGQGPGSQKTGIQYTNEGFYKDEDDDSMASSGPDVGGTPQVDAGNASLQKSAVRTAASLNTLIPDDESQAGSDRTDNEREVKPILTKERHSEDGYKSVWFKEDIDPNAKQDVVIIPNSREDDGDEDWDDDGHDNMTKGMPKVAFSDTDLDSGLGLRLEDQMDDSDDNEVL